jgi:hypothetical protein
MSFILLVVAGCAVDAFWVFLMVLFGPNGESSSLIKVVIFDVDRVHLGMRAFGGRAKFYGCLAEAFHYGPEIQ